MGPKNARGSALSQLLPGGLRAAGEGRLKNRFFLKCSFPVQRVRGINTSRTPHGLFAISGSSGKASGGILEGFDVFSGQFSINFPVEISRKNPFKSLLKALKRAK